jgi:hypothetical protein
MLFLQGARDNLADLQLLRPLVDQLGGRATLELFQDADHSFHVPARSGRTDKLDQEGDLKPSTSAGDRGEKTMCRNIKTLFNFDPPATDEEIAAASLQFVRKLSGFNKPSKVNEAAFDRAVEAVAGVARELIDSLVTTAQPRDREIEAQRARARASERFGSS